MLRTLFLLAAVVLMPHAAEAQRESPDFAAKSEAMKKLAFLAGNWEGTGSIQFGDGKSEFHGTEEVEQKIGGLAVVVEGLHKIQLPDGKERVIHNALGIISYSPKSESYQFTAHLATGRSGNYPAKLIDDTTFEWMIPDSPVGKIRYTIKIEKDTWHEVGEISRDGKEWSKFFEMTLKKVEGKSS